MIVSHLSQPRANIAQNQALAKFQVESSENLMQRQNHGIEFFKLLVSNDEWFSSVRRSDVWQNPHHDRETAVSLFP